MSAVTCSSSPWCLGLARLWRDVHVQNSVIANIVSTLNDLTNTRITHLFLALLCLITEVFCGEITVYIWAFVGLRVPKGDPLPGVSLNGRAFCPMRLKEPCGYYKLGKNEQIDYFIAHVTETIQ